MSTLARYRKTGGFVQLVSLLEGLGSTKRTQLLKIIGEEDPKWVEALGQKILTLDRVLNWPDEALMEIFSRIKPLTIGTVLHSLPAERVEPLKALLPASARLEVNDILTYHKPEPGQMDSAVIQMIQEVRNMVVEGHLSLKAFAPELIISDGIEEHLKGVVAAPTTEAPKPSALKQEPAQDPLETMSRKELLQHCRQLKLENSELRRKMSEQLVEVRGQSAERKSAA